MTDIQRLLDAKARYENRNSIKNLALYKRFIEIFEQNISNGKFYTILHSDFYSIIDKLKTEGFVLDNSQRDNQTYVRLPTTF